MNILVTGSAGFLGKNLITVLKSIQQKKNPIYIDLNIDQIYEYDIDSDQALLDTYCKHADFVFNLAGVNRTSNNAEYMCGNYDFASILLNKLKEHNNTCPVMLSSSIQATLLGRYANSDYGKSKLAGEELFSSYSKETGAKVLIYRLPNLFGKWCRPNYNSVIATFCNNYANDLPIQINDTSVELELVYIDDLVNELINALRSKEHHCEFDGINAIEQANGKFCYVPTTYRITLGQIVELLDMFKNQPITLLLPEIPENSFAKKLYSTYVSYLPKNKVAFSLKMNCDDRGSFTELLKTANCGQFSVNISKPGITKGQHWHHTKWEFFIVVSGHGLIQQRRIGTDEKGNLYPVMNFEVSGDDIQVVHILPGHTHNIINLSATENLVTIMWANEQFDIHNADTFYESV